MIPCKECLKFPICKQKTTLGCDDIVKWIAGNKNYKQKAFRDRLNEFENLYEKQVSVIMENSLEMYFKKKKDHHQCAIAKM